MDRQLSENLKNKTAKIGVIGLGYVGLPLIQAFIRAGYSTVGFDVDQSKVNQLLSGESYIGHIQADWIKKYTAEGRFVPTTDMNKLAEVEVILICVPTPLGEGRTPDLSYVEQTTREIAQRLKPGQLIVLESTTYPGTTRDVMLPILSTTGLKAEEDFFLAYSPEREDPGNPDFSASRIPKVVGGLGKKSSALAVELYSAAVVEVVPVSTCEVAEACKILENTYRSINIAMVNELKILFDKLNIDIWEVIDAAKTKPFGFAPFYPGPGLGGHCIPIDPFYLSWVARNHEMSTRFIELAGEINTSMPQYVVERLGEALNQHEKPIKGSKIAILGVAYKKDVDDPRESPSFKLLELLAARGAVITYNDPYIPVLPKMRSFCVPELGSKELTEEYLQNQDCVLIATDHSCYDYPFIVEHSDLVVDTRNATVEVTVDREKIIKA
ncbi:MAG: nucleotide sugar dehydrogenase [Pirellulaceae bacterium]|nr:nucleotide sugar dehydrogenase [Pirellulaceae bacterium]